MARRRGCKKSSTNKNGLINSLTKKSENESAITSPIYSYSSIELDKMYVSMLNVLNIIKLHDDSGPFLTPVEEDCAPGYFDVIKEPMDISTMEYKVHRKAYKNKKQFEKDFKKMVKNCEVFNGDGNVYTNMAYSIWRLFTESMKIHFPKNPKLEKEASSKLPFTQSEDLESSAQPKLYVCSSKNVDGAIKITIKQTETRIVPPTTLQSVKSNENGKPRFEIKKASSDFCMEKNQNLSYSCDTPKFELPSRRTGHPPNKANGNRPARGRKRKKKPIGMKAIEALAQAAERALKDAASRSSFDDGIFSSHSNSPIYNSNAFPDLKISTTQNHPADLLNRLFRKVNNDSSSCNSDKDSSIEKKPQVEGDREGPLWENGYIDNSPMLMKSSNDISNIFPCAAATLVFPRNSNSPFNSPPLKSTQETFHLSQPCLNKLHSRTKFSDDSEDSSAFESDCSVEDFESRNESPSNLRKCFPQIKPCQVTLSRLSPRLYYKGNKVRILEQVEKEKKRKKRLRSRSQLESMAKRELRSSSCSVFEQAPLIQDNRDKEEPKLEKSIEARACSSLSQLPINEYVPSPKPKTTNIEIRNETNFQQCWGKNVPPRKRYSSLVPTAAERKMFFEKENDAENVTASSIIVSEQRVDPFHPLNLTFGKPNTNSNPYEEHKFTAKNERTCPIVEEVKEESSPPAPLNTFQFEYITDSSSDEGYTTNERLSPILNAKNSWYYNSFASRIVHGDSQSGQHRKSSRSNNEPHFGTTPFGNSDLPNEKNGFSFEAKCPKDENFFYPIKTSSFIDFNMLTPLNLEIQTPNYCQNKKSLENSTSNFNYSYTKTTGSMFHTQLEYQQPNNGVPPFISSFP